MGHTELLFLSRVEEEVRTCQGNNMETPRSVEKEGQELLQALELRFPCSLWYRQTMVRQLCPCSPWGSMGDAGIHPQPVGIHGGCRDPPTAQGDPQGCRDHPQPLGKVPMPEQVDAWGRLCSSADPAERGSCSQAGGGRTLLHTNRVFNTELKAGHSKSIYQTARNREHEQTKLCDAQQSNFLQ